MQYQVFRSRENFEENIPKFTNRLRAIWNWDHPLVLEYKVWVKPRTLSQNALYWSWMEHMAHFFSRPGQMFSKDDMHDLMRHQFLGYEDKQIGSTEIRDQLKSTSKITKLEFMDYLSQIDAWAADHGCLLPHPETSDYMKYKEASR